MIRSHQALFTFSDPFFFIKPGLNFNRNRRNLNTTEMPELAESQSHPSGGVRRARVFPLAHICAHHKSTSLSNRVSAAVPTFLAFSSFLDNGALERIEEMGIFNVFYSFNFRGFYHNAALKTAALRVTAF